MSESKGRDIGRLLLSLLTVATAAAVCVAVIDSGGLLYRYGGGRVRSVGFSWVLQILLLRMEVDPFPDLPAIVSRYCELRDWRQWAQFLVAATLVNVSLTWAVAAVVTPLYVLFARSRAVLPGLWLLFSLRPCCTSSARFRSSAWVSGSSRREYSWRWSSC